MKTLEKFNYIYEKLVTSDEDVVGLIAYGIYKKHKIEFINKTKEVEGRGPNESECDTFFKVSTTVSQLGKYKDQAETILAETVGNVASEELERCERQMLEDYRKEIRNSVPSNWTTFFIGLLSAFAFSVIASLFFFIGGYSEKSTNRTTQKTISSIQKKF